MLPFKITQDKHIDSEIGAAPHFLSSIKYASPIHTHDFYEFFVITQGKCVHVVNDNKQRLSEGDLVFIRPNDIHYYEYDGIQDCQFINIPCDSIVMENARKYLGEDIYDKKLRLPNLPPCISLSRVELDEFEGQYYNLTFFSTLDKSQAKLQLKSMIIKVLSKFFQEEPCKNKGEIPLWLDSLLKEMQKEKNFTLGVSKMYELSGRSIGHINRVFKVYLNTTPTEYINRLRLGFAKNLILTTDLSIIEISMEAGFNNLSHFYHLFKKQFNTSPQSLRTIRER